jgi:hypothetical protein
MVALLSLSLAQLSPSLFISLLSVISLYLAGFLTVEYQKLPDWIKFQPSFPGYVKPVLQTSVLLYKLFILQSFNVI